MDTPHRRTLGSHPDPVPASVAPPLMPPPDRDLPPESAPKDPKDPKDSSRRLVSRQEHENRPLSVTRRSSTDPIPPAPVRRGYESKRDRQAKWLLEALAVQDLSVLSRVELRRIAGHMFQLMEADYVPLQVSERYESVVEELTARTKHLTEQSLSAQKVRITFRDASLLHRFELICDGVLASCLIYSVQGSTITLKSLIITEQFDDQDLQDLLIVQIILNLHKRRLRVRSLCPAVDAFLLENHRYQCLVHSSR